MSDLSTLPASASMGRGRKTIQEVSKASVPEGAARQAGGGAAAPLGTVARFASGGRSRSLPARVRRFMVQAGARELVPEERVASCLRRPIPGVAGVSVLYSPKQKAAHFGGLVVCGSVWMCPVCAAKISERRRVELSAALKAWGGQLVLATFTLQHTSSDELSTLLGDLQEAMRKMRSGRAWMELQKRYGMVGSIRALEVTYGVNGFHPHQHIVFCLAGGVDVEAFGREVRGQFLAAVAKVGRYASPRWGVNVQSSDAQLAAYVAKWGKEPKWTTAHELAKSVSKRGRGDGLTMLELLDSYVVLGDLEAGRCWREYALVFKGRKQLVYSPGLRAVLGLVVEEKSDQEVVEEAVEDAIVLAQLDLAAWRIVLANDARGELLDVADSGDPALVRGFLVSLGAVVVEVADHGS